MAVAKLQVNIKILGKKTWVTNKIYNRKKKKKQTNILHNNNSSDYLSPSGLGVVGCTSRPPRQTGQRGSLAGTTLIPPLNVWNALKKIEKCFKNIIVFKLTWSKTKDKKICFWIFFNFNKLVDRNLIFRKRKLIFHFYDLFFRQ